MVDDQADVLFVPHDLQHPRDAARLEEVDVPTEYPLAVTDQPPHKRAATSRRRELREQPRQVALIVIGIQAHRGRQSRQLRGHHLWVQRPRSRRRGGGPEQVWPDGPGGGIEGCKHWR